MTDTDETPPTTDAQGGRTAPRGPPPDGGGGGNWATWTDVWRNLLLGAIAVLGLLAAWATVQAYVSLSRAVEIWVSEPYVPIFGAAFNVIVVLVALAGILAVVRELS